MKKNKTYAFVVGMERCGTHSAANIIKAAAAVPAHVVHEEAPLLCREAQLVHSVKDFRTPDFRRKMKMYRDYGKKCQLICEANHRLSFFISTLMREFGPQQTRIVFLVRNPIPTLISRVSTWAHYKDYLHAYPDFFVKSIVNEAPGKKPFNEFRITMPKTERFERIADLYVWEWLETYKYARQELSVIPAHTRKIMFCEDLTDRFSELLGFVGMNNFKIDDSVMGWARLRGDSVYTQPKQLETDSFQTQNRDPDKDEIILYARNIINKNRDYIWDTIGKTIERLPMLDNDIVEMDKKVMRFATVSLI